MQTYTQHITAFLYCYHMLKTYYRLHYEVETAHIRCRCDEYKSRKLFKETLHIFTTTDTVMLSLFPTKCLSTSYRYKLFTNKYSTVITSNNIIKNAFIVPFALVLCLLSLGGGYLVENFLQEQGFKISFVECFEV